MVTLVDLDCFGPKKSHQKIRLLKFFRSPAVYNSLGTAEGGGGGVGEGVISYFFTGYRVGG